jgi:hypothetical protein
MGNKYCMFEVHKEEADYKKKTICIEGTLKTYRD